VNTSYRFIMAAEFSLVKREKGLRAKIGYVSSKQTLQRRTEEDATTHCNMRKSCQQHLCLNHSLLWFSEQPNLLLNITNIFAEMELLSAQDSWLQQDGAFAHYGLPSPEYLKGVF
jgi:hypothetical protein